MSGYAHELELARLAGVVLVERAVPARFVRDPQGRLTGGRAGLGRDSTAAISRSSRSGRRDCGRSPSASPASAWTIAARWSPTRARGATGHPKVFAGGDAMHGGELVVTAVQDGKRAARGICAALGIEIRPDSPMRAGHE